MKIIACIKQVPEKDTRFEINPQGTWIQEQELTFEINECDVYALEEALRLKEKHGGEVVLLSLGGESAEKTMRRGLALGADRGILILAARDQTTDPFTVARALLTQVRLEQPDLVLTGVRSDDQAFSQTGTLLAELLGWPHATIVMKIDWEAGAGRLTIQRELEAGLLEEVSLPFPAVLTIQQGINQVRYPSLKGIMAARKKELRRVNWAATGVSGDRKIAIEKLVFPKSDKKSEIIGGTPRDAAATLVEKMKKEMKIL
ncbi:MAG: electron transfer flavoprotein subunit beta/FixA family protein [Acidobacteria bacterium]|nr:electron transfer flavoprotein subunit beta/FixA family protein [Acidobacteriota bacterium]